MEAIINFFKEFAALLPTIQIMDVVDILVVAFVIYKIILMLQTTSSSRIAKSIIIILILTAATSLLHMYLMNYLLDKILEIGLLALVLLAVVLLWVFGANHLVLTAVHPQLASSRGIATKRNETLFTVAIAIVVTLAMSWVGLMVINSLLVLPAASSRNLARNLREYHLFSVLGALACSVLGLVTAYYLGCSAGATIALYLALYFTVTFFFRGRRQ